MQKVYWYFNPKDLFPTPRPCIVSKDTGKRVVIKIALLSRPKEFDYYTKHVNKSDGTLFDTKEEAFSAYDKFHNQEIHKLEKRILESREEYKRIRTLIEEYEDGQSETATSGSAEGT